MQNNEGRKTEQAHWESVSQEQINYRLPSKFNVDVLNMMRLLKKHVRPGSRYLEIGCAPGKMLAWVAKRLNAEVTGLDYSEPGITKCQALFDALRLKAYLYNDDFFNHHLAPESFDVVASFGVMEHFENARLVVHRHLELVKPGGLALITVPNYGGIYGRLQHWCDAPNLQLHNLKIMNPRVLMSLAEAAGFQTVRAYPLGAVSPWLVTWDKRLPRVTAKFISCGINALGLLQPLTINALAPMLVLEVHKRPSA